MEDSDCIIPLVRKEAFENHELATTKFEFLYDSVTTKRITSKGKDEEGEDITTTVEEEVTEQRVRKKVLKVFTQSSAEDVEHFFDAFETMQSVLEAEWKQASTAKHNDATILFNGFDAML